jgi:hypothetical protein
MPFRRPPHSLLRSQRELAKVGPTLGAAIERFRRDIEKASARQHASRRRLIARPSRLPSTHARRPAVHRAAHLHHVRPGAAPTVLQRLRDEDARRRAGTPTLAGGIQAGANRVTAVIRSRLLALRRGLSRLRPRRR